MKLWIYTVVDTKVRESRVIDNVRYGMEAFIGALRDACHEFDAATPLILPNHYKHFESFGIVRFKAGDFVEPIRFDALAVELFREPDTKKQGE